MFACVYAPNASKLLSKDFNYCVFTAEISNECEIQEFNI